MRFAMRRNLAPAPCLRPCRRRGGVVATPPDGTKGGAEEERRRDAVVIPRPAEVLLPAQRAPALLPVTDEEVDEAVEARGISAAEETISDTCTVLVDISDEGIATEGRQRKS